MIETEAELTAFLVAMRHGVRADSAEYLKRFFSRGQSPQFSLEAVLVTTGRVEDALRGTLRRREPPKQKATSQ